ncbi:MAG: SIMPL domain-containing protein [Anaerolineae bacterium]
MNKRLVQLLATGLLGIVALTAVACGGVASAAPAAQGGTPVPGSNAPTTDIGVNGTGSVFADPDTAIASLGVEITGPTLASASSDASTKMTAVLDKVKSLGVDAKDIKTVGYSVNPITSNAKEGETPRIIGYHVSNIVQIKMRKLDQVGVILDAAITAGANTLSGLYYTIDDPTDLTKQARTKAVADAMAKAQTLADAAKVKLGPIISITENVSLPRPVVYARSFASPAADAGVAPGPVEAGQNEISVTIEMHWQISQ